MSNIKVNVHNIFPTPIYETIYTFLDNEKDYIMKFDNDELVQNLAGNKTSKNTYVLENEKLSNLKNFIEQNIKVFLYQILTVNEEIKFNITQSWINFNKNNQSHHGHIHKNSIISGVLFVQGKQPITFTRDREVFPTYDLSFKQATPFTSGEFRVSCEPGKLLLFPSNIPHMVQINSSNETRVTLSFNTFMNCKIGNLRDLTELKI
jgi:uncharacterized protein (TIGR02466 family)